MKRAKSRIKKVIKGLDKASKTHKTQANSLRAALKSKKPKKRLIDTSNPYPTQDTPHQDTFNNQRPQ